MDELEVDCVQRGEGAGHHGLTHLGHQAFACRIPVALAMLQIRGRVNIFYTVDPASRKRAYIEVRREPGQPPHLQARLDGRWTEHLLQLPECRPGCRVIKEGMGSESRHSVRYARQRTAE